MQDTENITMDYGDDILLPEGWTEGDDPFDPDSWGKGRTGDAPADAPKDQQPETAMEAEPPPATGQDTAGDGGTLPATETAPSEQAPAGETAERKALRFKSRVNHQDVDVEVDESELPALYEKAQALDRARAREVQAAGRLSGLEEAAKLAGYDGLDSLLESVTKTRQEAEVKRLVGEGVHEEVAQDMVTRSFAQPQGQPQTSQQPAATAAPRDFRAEAAALLEARPELVGKPLPEQVVQACGQGKPLMAAYYEYEAGQARAEAERLRRENDIMKQNAANAARAPVKGVNGGGATDTKPEDDFLRGFNAGY